MFQIIHRKKDVNYARVTEIQTRYNIVILHGFVILQSGTWFGQRKLYWTRVSYLHPCTLPHFIRNINNRHICIINTDRMHRQ